MTAAVDGRPALRFRAPVPGDAAAIWELVKASGVLDLNSAYAYLLVCDHFAPTSVVVEQEGRVVGFVAGYRIPTRPDHYFVWQVGVDASARGQGLATRMIRHAVAQPACEGVRYVESTVTPSNTASRALFRGLARKLETTCREGEGYAGELFPGHGHEPEDRFLIGPFGN